MAADFDRVIDQADYQLLNDWPKAPLTQTWLYGQWQQAVKRPVERVRLAGQGYGQAVQFPLPAGRNYLYFPYGPVVNQLNYDAWQAAQQVAKSISNSHTIFVRFDFTLTEENADQSTIPAGW